MLFFACGEHDDTWGEVRCVCWGRGWGMDLDRSDEGDCGDMWMWMGMLYQKQTRTCDSCKRQQGAIRSNSLNQSKVDNIKQVNSQRYERSVTASSALH